MPRNGNTHLATLRRDTRYPTHHHHHPVKGDAGGHLLSEVNHTEQSTETPTHLLPPSSDPSGTSVKDISSLEQWTSRADADRDEVLSGWRGQGRSDIGGFLPACEMEAYAVCIAIINTHTRQHMHQYTQDRKGTNQTKQQP